jgi:hypothetical protein
MTRGQEKLDMARRPFKLQRAIKLLLLKQEALLRGTLPGAPVVRVLVGAQRPARKRAYP